MTIRYGDTGHRAADINCLSKTQSGEIQNKHLHKKDAKNMQRVIIYHTDKQSTQPMTWLLNGLEPKDEGAVLLVAIVVDVQQP